MWISFFRHSFDFSKAPDKFKRALTIMDVVLLVFSYIHSFEMHALVYYELLRVTSSRWSDFILNERSS